MKKEAKEEQEEEEEEIEGKREGLLANHHKSVSGITMLRYEHL